jgi:DNA-directed RNA polymerase subunit RPC12/RpoP
MGERPFAVVRPATLRVNLSGGLDMKIRCSKCRRDIPFLGSDTLTRNGFRGHKCPRCGNGHFFGTCTSHGSIIGFDTEQMTLLEEGDSIPCPEPTCAALLRLTDDDPIVM